jgi:hypothetical protein
MKAILEFILPEDKIEFDTATTPIPCVSAISIAISTAFIPAA